MLCFAKECHAVLAMLCLAVPGCARLCQAVPGCAVPCYAVLCCAMLSFAVLCCAMLCYAALVWYSFKWSTKCLVDEVTEHPNGSFFIILTRQQIYVYCQGTI
jgi:hypothetical protein